MSEWQSIETAPNETSVLVWSEEEGVSVATFMGDAWGWWGLVKEEVACEGQGDRAINLQPTHWMPLPEPPATS